MLRLTRHTERRLSERRIAVAWVEVAVSAPDWTAPDPDPSLTRSYRAIPDAGGRILRVVHRPEGPDILVITAHFDRSAKR